jgi:hypothetical protein
VRLPCADREEHLHDLVKFEMEYILSSSFARGGGGG